MFSFLTPSLQVPVASATQAVHNWGAYFASAKPFISHPQVKRISYFHVTKPLMKAGRLNEQIISFKNISWQESTTNAFLIAFALTSLPNTFPCVRWNPSYRYLQLWHSGGTGGLRLGQDAAGQRPRALGVLRPPPGCQGWEGWPVDSEILFKMWSSGPQLQKAQSTKDPALWRCRKDEHNEGELEISFVTS